MMIRGQMEADIIIAIFLFLAAYAFILISLPPVSVVEKKSADPLLGSAVYLSDTLVRTPGSPRDWNNASAMTSLGLAAYNRSVTLNVLDAAKLRAINGTDCSTLFTKADVPLDFRISVATATTEYACINPFPGGAVVERLVYVSEGNTYNPAVLRLHVRSATL